MPSYGQFPHCTFQGAPPARLGRAGDRRAHRAAPERLLVVPAIPGVTDVIRRAMENVYGRFGLGPATSYGSSSGNWADVYTGAAASAGTAAGTPSA